MPKFPVDAPKNRVIKTFNLCLSDRLKYYKWFRKELAQTAGRTYYQLLRATDKAIAPLVICAIAFDLAKTHSLCALA